MMLLKFKKSIKCRLWALTLLSNHISVLISLQLVLKSFAKAHIKYIACDFFKASIEIICKCNFIPLWL